MRDDLDTEMNVRGVEAIVVYGDTTLGNPDLAYVVGGPLARGGIYFKHLGEKPLLVTSNLDIGSARKAGAVQRIQTYTDWHYERLIAKHGRAEAFPILIATIVKSAGVKGRVVLLGRNDIATGLQLSRSLRSNGIRITGESSPTILEVARETKSAQELRYIKNVGEKTEKVVRVVVELLRNAKSRRGHLIISGRAGTIGNLKRLILSELASEDLITPEGTILAIGASTADPHNAGNPTDQIRRGKLIIFDIFPQSESGYWFDLTRPFVIGRAERKASRMYVAVADAYSQSIESMRAGISGESAMLKACEVIEKHGYQTIRAIYGKKAQSIKSGFVHSLGHGVGLTIGERPYLTFRSKEPLRECQVVTVEPGVYLPGFGGVRIEDTVAVTDKGVRHLTHLDSEFELT